MKNNSTWENMIKPVVVLFAICFVVSGLLAKTNDITAPIIAENAKKAEQAALIELLPAATGFNEVENVEMENVKKVYASDNEVGYVVTSAAKGYGGDIEWMCAFDTEGTIVGAKVLSQSETAGLGAKCSEPWFREQFLGTSSELAIEDIDAISGATISTKASLKAINAARYAFSKYALGIEAGPKGPEVTVSGNVYTTYADGFIGPITVYVTINEDGSIAAVTAEGPDETPEIGGAALPTLSQAVVDAQSADIDVVAGATFTSEGFINAVKAVLDAVANGTAVAGDIALPAIEETPVEETPTVEEPTVAEPVEEGDAVTVDGNVYTTTVAGFQSSDLVVKVTIEDGKITAVEIDESANPMQIANDDSRSAFAQSIVDAGSTEVDSIAGATITSDAVKTAVKACLDAYNAN